MTVLGRLAGLAIVGLMISGCGAIYRHTVVPLTVDFDRTPVSHAPPARGDVRQFRFRGIDLRWNQNAIGVLAREAGLQTIYYADVEQFSLLGIVTRTWVHVYGEPAEAAASTAPTIRPRSAER